jgi:hypothetical protein
MGKDGFWLRFSHFRRFMETLCLWVGTMFILFTEASKNAIKMSCSVFCEKSSMMSSLLKIRQNLIVLAASRNDSQQTACSNSNELNTYTRSDPWSLDPWPKFFDRQKILGETLQTKSGFGWRLESWQTSRCWHFRFARMSGAKNRCGKFASISIIFWLSLRRRQTSIFNLKSVEQFQNGTYVLNMAY